MRVRVLLRSLRFEIRFVSLVLIRCICPLCVLVVCKTIYPSDISLFVFGYTYVTCVYICSRVGIVRQSDFGASKIRSRLRVCYAISRGTLQFS